MEERFPTKELADLLRDFSMMEGVVQYVLINPDGGETSERVLHQEAAIFTLKTIENRLSRDGYNFPLTVEKEKMKETKVTLNEFLGPCFDLDRQKLILKGRHSPYLNDFFYAGEEERPDNIVTIQRSGSSIVQGYAQAFCQPPYNLDAEPEEINQLFLSFNHQLFGDFKDDLVIYQWSNDWSNYFEAGNEWWGSFLWTIDNRTRRWMVGIFASASD